VLRASAVVEKAGIPAVSLVASGFDALARVIGKLEGLKDSTIAVYPGVILTDSDEVFADKVRSALLPAVIAGLLNTGLSLDEGQSGGSQPAAEREYAPKHVVARGSLDEVLDAFEAREWSDSLPFIPPTIHRVEEFVERSGRRADEIIGVLPPAHREATIWSIAVNAVMAGCRPEYMPLLIAVVECLADPGFRLQDAGSTPGWEPLVVVSGALVDQLNFNSGTGATRLGRRANSTVGRFTRLYMRNVAGFMIPPGDTDQAGFGLNFNVALAEHQATFDEIGWPTLREDEGFAKSSSTVSVQSVVQVSPPIYSGGATPEEHLATVALVFRATLGQWATVCSYKYGVLYSMLAFSPSIAKVIALNGWTKDDVREYLGAALRAPVSELNLGQPGYSIQSTDRFKEFLRSQGQTDTGSLDDLEVPMLPDYDLLGITIAGNAARNQSRVFIGNHVQGQRKTREVSQ
jgi:hypothetical protein